MSSRIELVEQILDCEACPLHRQHSSPVPFSGQPGQVAVLGDAPSVADVEVCKPFVGLAGDFLRNALRNVGIDPDSVSYFNAASCASASSPAPEYVAACAGNRSSQLEWLDPPWVLVLGTTALKAVRSSLSLAYARRRPFELDGVRYFATYHPLDVLGDEPKASSETFWADIEAFAELIQLNEWSSRIPDSCSACAEDAVWLEDSGLGWCELHLPAAERRVRDRRMQVLERDYLRAKVAVAAARRDLGLEMVEAGADPGWMDRAWDTLVRYLRSHRDFFVDDFWSETGLERPAESRALGPLVMRAAREGLMEKSGEFRKSVASNLTEKPVWRSKVYAA